MSPPLIRAAQYLRMSTERQYYSIGGQSAANAEYAREHGYEIVRTYKDEARSGLTLERREGLKQLLADILGRVAPYGIVIVYDLSRWGRFQDLDEGAHYEFLCRSAGIAVEYSAEPFANDGSMAAILFKQLKRAVSAQFSSDLSRNIGRTLRGLRAEGCWVGGTPPYGFQRVSVAPDGERHLLRAGQPHDRRPGVRLMLAPGPPEEVAVVRRVFDLFVRKRLSCMRITRLLEAEGAPLPARGSRAWTARQVKRMLRNETYCGVIVTGQKVRRLRTSTSRPRKEWVRIEGAIEPIISAAIFKRAQRRFKPRPARPTRAELLADLQRLFDTHGYLTSPLINKEGRYGAACCKTHFGSVMGAYEAVGYLPTRIQVSDSAGWARMTPAQRTERSASRVPDADVLGGIRALLQRKGFLSLELIRSTPGLPNKQQLRRRFGDTAALYRQVGYVPSNLQAARFKAAEPAR